MVWIVLLIIVLLVVLAAFVITQFNKLRRLDQLCIGSFADIDTLLTKRADLIPNLVETVRGPRTSSRPPWRPSRQHERRAWRPRDSRTRPWPTAA